MRTLLALFCTLFLALPLAAQDGGYEVGSKARDFSLKNVDGKMLSLAANPQAKGYIVIFTCNHCPFSQAYEDRIIALHERFAKDGYPVVAINPNDPVRSPEDSWDNMKKRAREKKFGFPYLFDETQEIARTYGATRTPHVFLLQKKGAELEVAYIGAIDDNSEEPAQVQQAYLASAIDALKQGRTPDPAHTKAIGCTIKWKKQ